MKERIYMSINRIKQFYLFATDKVKKEDIDFTKKYLDKNEINIFNSLSNADKKHSIRVAYDVFKICRKENKDLDITHRLVKVALLHDVGKGLCKLNIIDRSLLVILDSLSNGKIKKFSNIKKIDIYYNHAEKAYNIFKNNGYDDNFLNLIKNHHSRNINIDDELRILMFCDDKN